MAIYEISSDKFRKIDETSFISAGLRERQDLQRLLRCQIEIVAPDTLVISEEFSEWQDSNRRIDLLGIDKNAKLVVIELKRTEDVAVIGMDAIAFQEPDPIQTQIQFAKDKYDLAIGNGSDLLVEQMDKKIQEVADSGDLKNVKFLVAEKKAFQKMAKLPESQTLKEEVEEFKTVLFKASTDLVVAYKIAIKQQTKLLKIDEADALVSEMEAFEAKSITSRPTKIDDGPTELRIETAKKRFIAEVASAKAAYDKKVADAESLLEKVFDEEAGKQQDKNVGKKILAQKEQYLVDSYSKNMKLVPTSKDEVFAEIISALNSGTWRCHWEEGSPFQGPYTFNVNRKGIDEKNQIRVRSMFVVQYQVNSFWLIR